MTERVREIEREYRQHFEEGGRCDGVCEQEAHAWVRDLLDALAQRPPAGVQAALANGAPASEPQARRPDEPERRRG